MAEMDRVDDIVVTTPLLALDSTGDKFRMVAPRDVRLIKSYLIQENATTVAAPIVTVESSLGDCTDTILGAIGGAADTIFEDHFREETNNNFSEGTRLVLEVTTACTAGDGWIQLVLRPI